MGTVNMEMSAPPFAGSSTYNRTLRLPGLEIETSANGGMADPTFYVTVNGVTHGINRTEDVEDFISRTVRAHFPDTAVRYPTPGHGVGRTMEPWRRG